jgi:hypothetical protein
MVAPSTLCPLSELTYGIGFVAVRASADPMPTDTATKGLDRWQRIGGGIIAVVVALLVRSFFRSPSSDHPSAAEVARQQEIASATVAALDSVDQIRNALSQPPPLLGGRAENALRTIDERLAGDPKFLAELARYQRSPTPDKKLAVSVSPQQEFGAQLAAQGLVRLSPDDFLDLAKLRLKLAESSKVLCAGMWSGGIPASEFVNGLERFSDEDLHRWVELTEAGMRLQLYATTPLPRFSGKVFVDGTREIKRRLPPEEQRSLLKTMDAGTTAPPEEACNALLVLMRGGLLLPPARRDPFLRALSFDSLVDWDTDGKH